MFRPLFTATVEYLLTYLVWKRGSIYPRFIAMVLFFLASYQFGEFIYFATDNEIGIRIAYFSTTMLPPLGLLLIERMTGKKYGYRLVQMVGIAFGLLFLLTNEMIKTYEVSGYFIRVTEYGSRLTDAWGAYYLATLLYSVVLLAMWLIREKNAEKRNLLGRVLLGYMSFFPTSIIFVTFLGVEKNILASMMCALALVASGIFAGVALNFSIKPYLDQLQNQKR